MAKPFNEIRMDAEKKKKKRKKPDREKTYLASRVLPYSIVSLGFDGIKMLPLVTILPQDGADIELVLKKRRSVLAALILELSLLN